MARNGKKSAKMRLSDRDREPASAAPLPSSQFNAPGASARGVLWGSVITAVVAALLLCANLGSLYLWQDEAATAVLANRLFQYGKPLAYDGRNLITMDVTEPAEEAAFGGHTRTAESAVDYYVARGDFKADTTWIGQPWGQFVAAGLSLKVLGQTTLAARLPFALAGLATAVVLYVFARRAIADPLVAAVAVALLLANVYWIVHMRQCRYYALSSLFSLLIVVTLWRWQHAARLGATGFVLASWCLFQCDFGSFWPMMGVSLAWVLLSDRQQWRRTLLTFVAIAVSVLPFVIYYELWSRGQVARIGRSALALDLLSLLNLYQLPLIIAAGGVAYLLLIRDKASRSERKLLLLCLSMIASQVTWMSLVTPYPFYRYLVNVTPISALAAAIVVVGSCRRLFGESQWKVAGACIAVLLLLSTTRSLSLPGEWLLGMVRPRGPSQFKAHDHPFLRDEWALLASDLGGTGPDPNRTAVEYLRARLKPSDEVLATYEDIPLMFYLPNPIRGGIPLFRLSDTPPPRFIVFRKYAPYLPFQQRLFIEEMDRHAWTTFDTGVIALRNGNNPDPAENRMTSQRRMERDRTRDPMEILERIESAIPPER